jgi:hypothetical protein
MSFLDRSVPLKHVILVVIAAAVFAGMSVYFLQSRSNEIERYGPALNAEVVKVDQPKTEDSILGLFGTTYTNAEVKVTSRSNEGWYYKNTKLDGKIGVGHELKAWFYNNSPDYVAFENELIEGEANATPWRSAIEELVLAFVCAAGVAFVAFLILDFLSPRKKQRNQNS